MSRETFTHFFICRETQLRAFLTCREKWIRALRPEKNRAEKAAIRKVLGFCASGPRLPPSAPLDPLVPP